MATFSFRSASDVRKKYLSFELVNDAGDILLDIGMSDNREIYIAFGPSSYNKIFALSQLEDWIEHGKELVLADAAETDAVEEEYGS